MEGRATCRAMTPRESMQAVVFVLDEPGPVMSPAARRRCVGIFAHLAYPTCPTHPKTQHPVFDGCQLV